MFIYQQMGIHGFAGATFNNITKGFDVTRDVTVNLKKSISKSRQTFEIELEFSFTTSSVDNGRYEIVVAHNGNNIMTDIGRGQSFNIYNTQSYNTPRSFTIKCSFDIPEGIDDYNINLNTDTFSFIINSGSN